MQILVQLSTGNQIFNGSSSVVLAAPYNDTTQYQWFTIPDGSNPTDYDFSNNALTLNSVRMTARLMATLRAKRNSLLMACDWTQSADAPTWINKTTWATYRQVLRDLPANTPDPSNVTWPTQPT